MDRNRIKIFRTMCNTDIQSNNDCSIREPVTFYCAKNKPESLSDCLLVSNIKSESSKDKKKDVEYNWRCFNTGAYCLWLLAAALFAFSNVVCQVHCSPLTTVKARNSTMNNNDMYDQATKPTIDVKAPESIPKEVHSVQKESDEIYSNESDRKVNQKELSQDLKTNATTKSTTNLYKKLKQQTQTTETTKISTEIIPKVQTTKETKKVSKSQMIPKNRKPQVISKNKKKQTTTEATETPRTTTERQKLQTTKVSQSVQSPEDHKTSRIELEKPTTKIKEKPKTTRKPRTTQRLNMKKKGNTVVQTSQKPQTTRQTTEKSRVTNSSTVSLEMTKEQITTVHSTENPTKYATTETTPKTTRKPIGLNDDIQCPESSMAYYNVTFVPLWSSRRFPKMYPVYRPHAQWSKTIGRTHSHNYTMWKIGSYASVKVKTFAETGATKDFDSEIQGHDSVLDVFELPAIGKGYGQSKGSMFLDSSHPFVSLMVKIIPSPDWFVGVSSLNLCSKQKWKKKVVMKLSPVDAGTDIGLTFTAPNWPAYPPEKINRITSSFPNHEASSFHYKSLKKLPRIAYATFHKVEEYLSVFKRTRPYKSRLPSLTRGLPNFENKPSIQNTLFKPSTNAQTDGQPVSSPHDDNDEDGLGNITNLLEIAENEPAIPLDCEVSPWGEWGSCSKSCEYGRRERFRFVTQERKNNGLICPLLKEEEMCGSMRNCKTDHFKFFYSLARRPDSRKPAAAEEKRKDPSE
ncbi:spondin-1-like [Argonauta hians]